MENKRYRLLRDLPFVKVGTISELDGISGTIAFKDDNDVYLIDLNKVPKLIKEGWIEEVQEKEFTEKEVIELMEYYRKNYYDCTRCMTPKGTIDMFRKSKRNNS